MADPVSSATDAKVSLNAPAAGSQDVRRWIDRIERAEKDVRRHAWETRCRKVMRRYKDEREGNEGGAHVPWFCRPRTSANWPQLLAVASRRHAERLPETTFVGLSGRGSVAR